MKKYYNEEFWKENEKSNEEENENEFFRDEFFSESENEEEEESGSEEDFEIMKTKGRKLPDNIKRLIGESTMCYVRKEYQKALEYCAEVIRLAPSIPDSYQTLAMVYLDLNDRKQAENYFMIAAHIKRTDAHLWKTLAEMFKEDGDEEQYYYCLCKAVMHDNKNIDLLYERIQMGKKMEDKRGVLMTFQYLIALDGRVTTAQNIIKALLMEKKVNDAATIVFGAIKSRMKEKKTIDIGLANICMELLLDSNRLQDFKTFSNDYFMYINMKKEDIPIEMKVHECICNIRLGMITEAEETILLLSSTITEETVDLVNCLAIELMKKKEYEKALHLFLLIHDIDKINQATIEANCSMCYFYLGEKDIAITMADTIHSIVGSRIDITYLLMNHFTKIKNYSKVIEIFNQYFTLFQQDIENNLFDPSQLDEEEEQNKVVHIFRLKMKALYVLEQYQECYYSFLWFFGKLLQKEEIDLIRSRIKLNRFNKNRKWRRGAVLNLLHIEIPEEIKEEKKRIIDVEKDEKRLFHTRRKRRKNTIEGIDQNQSESQSTIITIAPPLPSEDLDWNTTNTENTTMMTEIDDMSQSTTTMKLEKKKRHVDRNNKIVKEIGGIFVLFEEIIGIEKIQKYIIMSIHCCSKLEIMEECRNYLEMLISLYRTDIDVEIRLRMSYINIAVDNKFYDHAIGELKSLSLLLPYREDIWYFFNKVIVLSQRQTNPTVLKYFSRMHQKYPTVKIITIILGNLFLTTCQYNKALQQYLSIYNEEKDSPIINLSIALCYLGDVSNRNTIDKTIVFSNVLHFMKKYSLLCISKKESLYNCGRMYHQLDINYMACHCYEQALITLPLNQNDSLLDREIAYNLSLLYLKAGNKDLCRKIRQRYLQF